MVKQRMIDDVIQNMIEGPGLAHNIARCYHFLQSDIDRALGEADPQSARFVALQILRIYATPDAQSLVLDASDV